MSKLERLRNDEARMTNRPRVLVPRFCLETHLQRGSASSSIQADAMLREQFGRRSLRVVRCQAEPGNEESLRDLESTARRARRSLPLLQEASRVGSSAESRPSW